MAHSVVYWVDTIKKTLGNFEVEKYIDRFDIWKILGTSSGYAYVGVHSPHFA